jgi:hypothetical protein
MNSPRSFDVPEDGPEEPEEYGLKDLKGCLFLGIPAECKPLWMGWWES